MNANTLQLLAVLNLAASLVIPLIHSAITNVHASEPVKTIITALFTAVVGFFTPFLAGTQSWATFDWQLAAISIGTVFFGTVLSHYGLWKPLTVTGSDGKIQSAIPGGIGGGSSAALEAAVQNAFPVPAEPTDGPTIESIQALTEATGAPEADVPTPDPATPPASA